MRTQRIKLIKLVAICTNNECNFQDDVMGTDYKKWVTTPCPLCGSTVLTIDDYKFLCAYEEIIDEMNEEPLTEEELAEPLYTSSTMHKHGVITSSEPVLCIS